VILPFHSIVIARRSEERVTYDTVSAAINATGSDADTHLTPLGGNAEPGVAILGNALDSIRQGRFVREVGRNDVALGLLPLLAITMYAVPRLNLRLSALLVRSLLVDWQLKWDFPLSLLVTDTINIMVV
jgi:hypothetical protein